MRAISRARPAAVSSVSSSRPVKRFSRCSRSSVRMSSVETRELRLTRRSAKVSSVRRLLRSIRSTRFRQAAAMALELRRELRQVAQHPRRYIAELADLLFHLAGGGAALLAYGIHAGDEFRDAGDQRVFQRAHVLVRAGEHFLQQDIGLAQPLEQSRGVAAQHAVGFQHLGDGGRSGLLRLFDRRMGRLPAVPASVRVTAMVALTLASLMPRVISCALVGRAPG